MAFVAYFFHTRNSRERLTNYRLYGLEDLAHNERAAGPLNERLSC